MANQFSHLLSLECHCITAVSKLAALPCLIQAYLCERHRVGTCIYGTSKKPLWANDVMKICRLGGFLFLFQLDIKPEVFIYYFFPFAAFLFQFIVGELVYGLLYFLSSPDFLKNFYRRNTFAPSLQLCLTDALVMLHSQWLHQTKPVINPKMKMPYRYEAHKEGQH